MRGLCNSRRPRNPYLEYFFHVYMCVCILYAIYVYIGIDVYVFIIKAGYFHTRQ